MLNVDDWVVFSDGGSPWNSSEGVVIEINCQTRTNLNVTAVSWKSGEAREYQDSHYPDRGYIKNFTVHLKPLYPVYKGYDPTQAGDTDDDI